MKPHPQLWLVCRVIAELEEALGAALANKEMDLVVSFASALDALQRTRHLLETKSG